MPNSKQGKTGKLPFVICYIISLFLLTSCYFQFDPTTEKRNITYKEYNNRKDSWKFKLPDTTTNIDWFYYGARDTSYQFIQAKVKRKDVNLEELVKDFNFYHVPNPLLFKNIDFKMRAFYNTFPQAKPSWWNAISTNTFKTNILRIGHDNEYGNDKGYLKGCWVFYDDDNEVLRIFCWVQQHLSLFKFASNFKIPSVALTESYPYVSGKLKIFEKGIDVYSLSQEGPSTNAKGELLNKERVGKFSIDIQYNNKRVKMNIGDIINGVKLKDIIKDTVNTTIFFVIDGEIVSWEYY